MKRGLPSPKTLLAPESRSALLTALLLIVAVLLGGASATGIDIHLAIQALSFAVLLFVAVTATGPEQTGYRVLLAVLVAAAGFSALQAVPLPFAVRGMLPGGGEIRAGFDFLAASPPAMPLSLAPISTWSGLFDFVLPIALFATALSLTQKGVQRPVLFVVFALGVLSAGLAIPQLLADQFYLYEVTNRGFGVGLFANVNHQGTFCAMVAAMAAAYTVEGLLKRPAQGDKIAIGAVVGIIMAMASVGTGSVAALGLVAFAFVGAAAIYLHAKGWLSSRLLAIGAGLAVVGGVMGLLVAAMAVDVLAEGQHSSDYGRSRGAIWSTSLTILKDYWLLGTGLGSYPDIYVLYERAEAIDEKFVNHAHNDYLEWLVEMGLPGLIIGVAGLFVLGRRVVQVWGLTDASAGILQKGASVALIIPFLHSVVDYPLRTPAIMALTALCAALIFVPLPRPSSARRGRSGARG